MFMHSVRQPRKYIVILTFPERITYKIIFNHFASELTKEDNSLSYLHILHKLKKRKKERNERSLHNVPPRRI